MTLDQFRATKRWTEDLGNEPRISDESFIGEPGWVYHEGELFIESRDGKPYLMVDRSDYTGELSELERILYGWAMSEGFFGDI